MNRQQAKPKGFVQNQSLTPQPRGSEYAIDDDPNQSAGKNILSMTSLNKFHVRRPAELKRMKPEMVVSRNVVMKADLKFQNLLRVEGTVEGKIIAPPDAGLVLCSSGTFLGDICGLGIVYVDGKVKGNIFVDHLGLGPNAQVHGNVFCKRIEVAGSGSVIGQLLVSASAQIPTGYIERAKQPLVVEQPDSDEEDDDYNVKDGLGGNDGSPQSLQIHKLDKRSDSREENEVDLEDQNLVVGEFDDNQEPEYQQPHHQEPEVLPKEDKRRRSRRNNKDASETVMIIHEPQADFYPGGNWYTKAIATDESIERLAEFIVHNVRKIDRIIIIMDIHQNLNPKQSAFWENIDGEHPTVGTEITVDDIMTEKWTPTENIPSDEVLSWFVTDATTSKVSSIIVQPKHGQLGGPGAAIVPHLHEVISKWCDVHKDEVQYILSKSSSKEEKHNYHALLHEDDYDLSQAFETMSRVNKVLLAGQYQSHCRRFTLRHIAEDFLLNQKEFHGVHYNPESVYIMTDGISFSPPGFDIPEEPSEYIHELNQLGYTLTTTDELLL